jgi:hypothetical protein
MRGQMEFFMVDSLDFEIRRKRIMIIGNGTPA